MSKLQELLTDELRDLYDAEKQLMRALPKLARVATAQELKQAFLEHAEVTKNQAARLEQVFELLGQRAKSKPCKAMKGLIEEANEHVTEHERGNELDAVLVASAQRVEHYEIAGYGTARSYAKSIRNREVADLLNETLKEEEMTDKLLSKIGLEVQKQVLTEEQEDARAAEEQKGRYESEAQRARSKTAAGRGSSRSGQATAKKKVAGRGASGNGTGRAARAAQRGGGRTETVRAGAAGTRVSTDHDEIRRWAEERGAHPACVRGTGNKGDIGMIRLDFPGYSGDKSLEQIEWDEFFQKFDDMSLALLYQESTARGQKSNFNKLVSRETAEAAKSGAPGSARRSNARTSARSR